MPDDLRVQELRSVFLKLREQTLKEGWKDIGKEYRRFFFVLDENGVPVKIRDPNAFFIGALVDRLMRSEIAWKLPLELKKRLGTIDPHKIAQMDVDELASIIRRKPALHRLPREIARVLIASMKLLVEKYDGDASRIWDSASNYEELKKRLLEFPGIGDKIANMIIRMLNDYFGYQFEGVDLPVDRNDIRLVKRLTGGTLTPKEFARLIFPQNPYLADDVMFYIGRNFCRPTNPKCEECPLNRYCNFWQNR
jgi:endonuclease-3